MDIDYIESQTFATTMTSTSYLLVIVTCLNIFPFVCSSNLFNYRSIKTRYVLPRYVENVFSNENIEKFTSATEPFIEYVRNYLVYGPRSLNPRFPTQKLKPFYAVDFGSKKELKDKYPIIIIAKRNLQVDKNGILRRRLASGYFNYSDAEVRTIWQPWLQRRCNFTVRYIFPHQLNIVRIMQQKKLFSAKVVLQNNSNIEIPDVHIAMSFKPPWSYKLFGAKTVQILDPIDSSYDRSESTRSRLSLVTNTVLPKVSLRSKLFNSAMLHRLIAPRTVDILEKIEQFRMKPGYFFSEFLRRVNKKRA